MSLTIAVAPHTRTPTPDTTAADRARLWLARLPDLDLTAFTPAHSTSHPDLSAAESAAAARAAACPDLFVVHAADHAAGESVIAELVRLCAAAGERVLILSPDPAAADRLTERVLKAGCPDAIRALADDENPVRPLPLVGRATAAAVLAARAEQLPREAAAAVAAADARLSAVERLIELNETAARLDAEAADLAARADSAAAAVRDQPGASLAQKFDSLRAESEVARGRLEGEQLAALAEHKRLAEALERLNHDHAAAVAEGAKKPGLLTRLFGGAKHGPDAGELEKAAQQTRADLAATDARLADLRATLDGLAAALEADREKAVAEEVAARRAEFDARLAEVAAARARVAAEADSHAAALSLRTPAAGELVALRDSATRDLLAARERAAEVERSTPELARRSLAAARAVVGTPGSLHADPVFDRGTAAAFDLLVLDRAEDLTEHDFVQLAKLARRWVLVGDVPPVDEPPAPRGPSRNGRPAAPRFGSRLARILDRETWGFEPDRLICRLTFPHPARRAGMAREPLLDCPEIELRFAEGENDDPVLAEVAFPAGTAVPAARAFLFHQLGEVLLRPCGEVHWHHQPPAAITACWPAAECGASPSAAEWIDLEPGVREKIVGHGLGAFTAAVAFDPAHGWDADRAAAWLEEHTPAPSASRFAAVPAASPAARRR